MFSEHYDTFIIVWSSRLLSQNKNIRQLLILYFRSVCPHGLLASSTAMISLTVPNWLLMVDVGHWLAGHFTLLWAHWPQNARLLQQIHDRKFVGLRHRGAVRRRTCLGGESWKKEGTSKVTVYAIVRFQRFWYDRDEMQWTKAAKYKPWFYKTIQVACLQA
jgi:hypothetical protein